MAANGGPNGWWAWFVRQNRSEWCGTVIPSMAQVYALNTSSEVRLANNKQEEYCKKAMLKLKDEHLKVIAPLKMQIFKEKNDTINLKRMRLINKKKI